MISFGDAVELVAVLLFLVVVVQVWKIGRITGTFRAWNMISIAFALIVLRRAVSFLARIFKGTEFLTEIIVPIILVVITVFFIAGFHQLIQLFQKPKADSKHS